MAIRRLRLRFSDPTALRLRGPLAILAFKRLHGTEKREWRPRKAGPPLNPELFYTEGVTKGKKLVTAILTTGALIGGGWMVTRGDLVTEVLDGDSFKIANKQTIRLASLDAPELEFCMGPEAKAALTKKILNKRVLLRDEKTDIYRRIIALVYVNGSLVNEYMIRNGFAASSRQAGDENPAVRAANDYARNNHLGIFSPRCWAIDAPDPKCPIKGNIDDRNKAKEYLTPDCPDYSKTIIEKSYGEDWFCTIAEAKKAGYVRSSSCTR